MTNQQADIVPFGYLCVAAYLARIKRKTKGGLPRFVRIDEMTGRLPRFARNDELTGRLPRFARNDELTGRLPRCARNDEMTGSIAAHPAMIKTKGRLPRFARNDEFPVVSLGSPAAPLVRKQPQGKLKGRPSPGN